VTRKLVKIWSTDRSWEPEKHGRGLWAKAFAYMMRWGGLWYTHTVLVAPLVQKFAAAVEWAGWRKPELCRKVP